MTKERQEKISVALKIRLTSMVMGAGKFRQLDEKELVELNDLQKSVAEFIAPKTISRKVDNFSRYSQKIEW
ncbi:hypothetical protein ES705_06759 [subsurface metagenome]